MFHGFVHGRLDLEDTRKAIGADSLAFLPLERLRGMLEHEAPTFCDACFSGAYPVPPRDLTKDKEENLKPVHVVVEGYEGKIEASVEENKAAEEATLQEIEASADRKPVMATIPTNSEAAGLDSEVSPSKSGSVQAERDLRAALESGLSLSAAQLSAAQSLDLKV